MNPPVTGSGRTAGRVAFVLKGFPRISETFIAQEIRALERRGLDIAIYALRRPAEALRHPVHGEIRAPVHYLPEYLHREPRRVLRAWRRVRRRPGYAGAVRAWLRDLRRDPSANRVRRFGQALVLAAEIPEEVVHLHAHFLHTPASVTRYAALVCALPWSCSAHAKDIWTTSRWEKAEKLAECRWLVTCTASNHRHLKDLAAQPARVELVYHGLDSDRFSAPEARRPPRDGSDPADPVVILSVGRAVEKKGYEDLLAALAALVSDRSWRFVHVGGGPLLAGLQRRARELGIADRVQWCGPRPQQEVLERYRGADIFVLACRVARDGDRDGLPNVLLEAQSQKLPCISTSVSGVPELIEDDVTGLLVAPADPGALARAIDRLAADPELRARLGEAGFGRVRATFSMEGGINRLAALFGLEPEIRRRA